MTRTKKGKKPTDWDYWGKRPIGMGQHGTKDKRIGIKKERATLKQELKEIEKRIDKLERGMISLSRRTIGSIRLP